MPWIGNGSVLGVLECEHVPLISLVHHPACEWKAKYDPCKGALHPPHIPSVSLHVPITAIIKKRWTELEDDDVVLDFVDLPLCPLQYLRERLRLGLTLYPPRRSRQIVWLFLTLSSLQILLHTLVNSGLHAPGNSLFVCPRQFVVALACPSQQQALS